MDAQVLHPLGDGRTSHEVRGLKRSLTSRQQGQYTSHLTRGAWIETLNRPTLLKETTCRTSHEVRGLKRFSTVSYSAPALSHLTRGAWIETGGPGQAHPWVAVAPHTRCVD